MGNHCTTALEHRCCELSSHVVKRRDRTRSTWKCHEIDRGANYPAEAYKQSKLIVHNGAKKNFLSRIWKSQSNFKLSLLHEIISTFDTFENWKKLSWSCKCMRIQLRFEKYFGIFWPHCAIERLSYSRATMEKHAIGSNFCLLNPRSQTKVACISQALLAKIFRTLIEVVTPLIVAN